uniref:Uncharacterized protein n=1 Tax=Octopus bimaculoides TaxID=37653 RepID=A0A0L8I438_OCTBM
MPESRTAFEPHSFKHDERRNQQTPEQLLLSVYFFNKLSSRMGAIIILVKQMGFKV